MARTDDNDDPGYAALPLDLQRRIDNAFDSALSSSRSPPSKRRRLLGQDQAPAPGGFLLDDAPPGGFFREDSPPSGGFLPDEAQPSEDQDDQETVQRHIPLSLIPTALQILDLQADDEDVLSVFRNAASGWNDRSTAHSGDPSDALVSRKDWRAVCAALLDPGLAGDDDVDIGGDQDPPSGSEADVSLGEELSDSGEEYMQSVSSVSDGFGDDSDDEYREGGFLPAKDAKGKAISKVAPSSHKSRRGRGRKRSISYEDGDEEDARQHGLSARQKKECRATFALFFPDVPDASLDAQRIRIKDITRVAALLKEKISAEETVEMLDAFSTAADRSMGLADFERMMVAAKLA
ncbi:hypothetical protein BD311DRAFT_385339 [Dichomitus squalens]|uniref:EF-hand domain-containing protein n=1 Tax=Dichomitus squalens TaxID=114155 RepID=A0A4Q9MIJ2_9APHY|nr:hypothetical protein BD311DRAFT_385339 [Dichomitus squalens]